MRTATFATTWAPKFEGEFSQFRLRYVSSTGEAGYEWQIPLNMIDRFNELTMNRNWVPWAK